ncbi:MAG: hypothetical protein JO264_05475 [Acidisphaera sp.]|nr:hypothetical protein [Acidisphaera sp.]
MAYQVRIGGKSVASYVTQEEALEHVKRLVADDVNSEPEIVNSETGRSVEPASTKAWRDHLSNKIGY